MKLIAISIFFFFFSTIQAQYIAEDLPEFPFVQLPENKLQSLGDSTALYPIFDKLDSLILSGHGQIKVMHLGGSHIQAGVLSAQFAKRLQEFHPGLKGSRGFVFPYSAAKTNTPSSYTSSYTGHWVTCKSTQRKRTCELGLSGISIRTNTDSATISITGNLTPPFLAYEYNRITIFHGKGNQQYQIQLLSPDSLSIPAQYQTDTLAGLTHIELPIYAADSLKLLIHQTQPQQNEFTLHGITLQNDNPGITYYPIGVNGTSIPSYLGSSMLPEHLAEINPNWIIMTLGTNDAYGKRFDPARFKAHYLQLIATLRATCPTAVLLLTVPNDSYLYRRYANPNTAKTAQVITELSREENLVIWNFYEVMGGLNSVAAWKHENLARADRIHFTPAGYRLQADLLFAAFVQAYEKYHAQQPLLTNNPH